MARMEAATWKRTPRAPRRRLSRRTQWAIGARLVVGVAAMTVVAGMAGFGTHEPGRAYDPRGGGFNWTAVEPVSGRDVPRAEWIARAS